MTPRRARVGVGALAVLAAVVSLWVGTDLFPYRSINHDEAVYLQQAAMLLEGQMFLHPPVEDAFRPWFFVERGDLLYSKYSPPTAALWALAKGLTGHYVVALPIVAAAAVSLTYAVTAEAFDRATALIAAALFAGAPLFIVQSGTFLSYLPTTVANLTFAYAYLRAQRTGSLRLAAGAGAAVGIAFFARPYTAVLFALPFVAHAVLSLVGSDFDPPVVRRQLLTALCGLAGVCIALGYNWIVTGDPLVFPYQAFAPLDGVGFGRRRLLGYERTFTPALGVRASVAALSLFWTQWVSGGLLGTGLAVLGLARLIRGSGVPELPASYRPLHGRWLIAAVAVPVVLGNVAFWGTLNALTDPADPAGLLVHLGPFYHLDLLLPTAVLGAWGLRGLWDWTSAVVSRGEWLSAGGRTAVLVTAVLLVTATLAGATIYAGADAYARNQRVTDTYEQAYAPFESATFEDGVIYVPQTYGPWLNHPYQTLRNDPGFNDGPVFALQETAPFAVATAFDDRSLYRFVRRGPWAPTTRAQITTAVRPIALTTGERVEVQVRMGVPAAYETVVVTLEHEGATSSYVVQSADGVGTLTVVVSQRGLRVAGDGVTHVDGPRWLPAADGRVELRAFLDRGTGAGVTYRLAMPVDIDETTVSVLTPYRELCVALRRCGGSAAAIPGTLPPGLWLRTNASAAQESFLDTDRDDRPGDGRSATDWIERGLAPPLAIVDGDLSDVVTPEHRAEE